MPGPDLVRQVGVQVIHIPNSETQMLVSDIHVYSLGVKDTWQLNCCYEILLIHQISMRQDIHISVALELHDKQGVLRLQMYLHTLGC